MLKKTITFKDLDGNDVTEDFYFNLSAAEIAEMQIGHEGGFDEYLNRIVETNDGGEIIATFKQILMKAVGRRSEDGRRFLKSQEIIDDFIQSDAYSTLFMSLVTDGEAAAEFIKAVLPADLMAKLEAVPETKDETPAYILEDREPTNEELMRMTPDEVREAYVRRTKRDK